MPTLESPNPKSCSVPPNKRQPASTHTRTTCRSADGPLVARFREALALGPCYQSRAEVAEVFRNLGRRLVVVRVSRAAQLNGCYAELARP